MHTPPRSKAPMTYPATLAAMQLHTETIHGHRLAYATSGQGPVLLLVHGIGASHEHWRHLLAPLARRHTVIAPDLPGHGRSDPTAGDYSVGGLAAGLRDLLLLLGHPRATIVGHSLGGGVAMQFAYQFPEHCDRLVLVDSGGLGREVSWMLRLLAAPGVEYALPLVFPSFASHLGNNIVQLLHGAGFRNARALEMWRAYASLTNPENRKAFVRTLHAVIEPGGQSVSAMDRLYLTARMPTLIIWGDQDDIIPVSHAHAAHEAIPGSQLEIIEGAGHFPHVEEPIRFVEILSDFMVTTQPSDMTDEERRELLLTYDPSVS